MPAYVNREGRSLSERRFLAPTEWGRGGDPGLDPGETVRGLSSVWRASG